MTAEAEKREEKILAIKKMIEAEKQKFVVNINERLERMIKNIVMTKVKERVKAQVVLSVNETPRSLCSHNYTKVAELVDPYRKILQGSKGRNMRNQMFLANM